MSAPLRITRNATLSAALLFAAPLAAQHDHHEKKQPAAQGSGGAENDSSAIASVDAAMAGHFSANAALHMDMTPKRAAAAGDSARAARVVRTLRASIAKYRDSTAAVKDGYRMFAPNLKEQRIYHFTHYGKAIRNSFGFDAARPTSLLYRKDDRGELRLIGAMYTAPKRATIDQLDERIPLSIATWHRHVNICAPKKVRDRAAWATVKDGAPVFGPLSPIATEEACTEAGGRFIPQIFGWMVHANVFDGDDPKVIWGEEHGTGGAHDH